MYLLDTNIVSEFRRYRPHGAVLAWAASVGDDDMHISAVTSGELQVGVELICESDPGRASDIEHWVDAVAATYNVLPVDNAIFRCWALLMHRRSDDLIEDAIIAATARSHRLTVVTRNVRDFEQFGVPTLNPFVARSD